MINDTDIGYVTTKDMKKVAAVEPKSIFVSNVINVALTLCTTQR